MAALTDAVDGYVIARQSSVRGSIDVLRSAYYFDGVESGALVKYVKRGSLPMLSISESELGARGPDEELLDLLITQRKMDVELPRVVHVNYMSPATVYDRATKLSKRLVGNLNDQATLDLPLTLTDTKAQQIADTNLYAAWMQRKSYAFTVSKFYARLEPTDVIAINGNSMRIVATTITPKGLISVEAISDESSEYTHSSAVTETLIDSSITGSVTSIPPTKLEIL